MITSTSLWLNKGSISSDLWSQWEVLCTLSLEHKLIQVSKRHIIEIIKKYTLKMSFYTYLQHYQTRNPRFSSHERLLLAGCESNPRQNIYMLKNALK